MSLVVWERGGVIDGAPRVSGDEPLYQALLGGWLGCSPREWG